MSIATKRGDSGQTGLAGGIRVSKSDLRVETYGTVDELNTVLGFARSICDDVQIKEWTKVIQRTLFRLGSNLATPPERCTKSKLPKGWFRIGLCREPIRRRLPMRWHARHAAVPSGLWFDSSSLVGKSIPTFWRT